MKKLKILLIIAAVLVAVLAYVPTIAQENNVGLTDDQLKENGVIIEGSSSAEGVDFGVISDVHIGNTICKEQINLLETLLYFNNEKADSIFVVGDLTNNGSLLQYERYKATLAAADLKNISIHESLGNHDRSGSECTFKAITGDEIKAHYKINGYHFITLSPAEGNNKNDYSYLKEWLKDQLRIAQQDTGNKPIFVFAHHQIKNTVYVSEEWYGKLDKALFDDYPQVVLFGGHSHATNNHPQSIWQGTFTAINTVTLSYLELESGYGSSTKPAEKGYVQCVMVNVSGSKVKVTTHDLISGMDIENQVWTFDTSTQVKDKPDTFKYNNEIRKQNSKEPVFPEDAKITIDSIVDGKIIFTFEQAKIQQGDEGDIVHSYRFVLKDNSGTEVATWKNWSKFYVTPTPETLTETYVLPSGEADYTMYIYPVNAYGKEGKPISTNVSSTNKTTIEALFNRMLYYLKLNFNKIYIYINHLFS